MQKAPGSFLLVLRNDRSSNIHLAVLEAHGIAVALRAVGGGGLGVATPFTGRRGLRMAPGPGLRLKVVVECRTLKL